VYFLYLIIVFTFSATKAPRHKGTPINHLMNPGWRHPDSNRDAIGALYLWHGLRFAKSAPAGFLGHAMA
jgi:hypothetical protein